MTNRPSSHRGFTLVELMTTVMVLSLLAAVAVPAGAHLHAERKLAQCQANLGQVSRAVLQYAGSHENKLPRTSHIPAPGGWWTYKEEVKGFLGLSGPASPSERVFACPDDRGYGEGAEEPTPFCQSKKYAYTSYVFNGVSLPGVPNISGRDLGSIRTPARTLLVMEWPAHAPLSWHRSRTGRANMPFYNDAECVVAYVDGRVALTKIYYDGMNAAYTRDPIAGYQYQYSGD